MENIIVLNNIILEFLRPTDLQYIAQIALFAFLNLEVDVCGLFPLRHLSLAQTSPPKHNTLFNTYIFHNKYNSFLIGS